MPDTIPSRLNIRVDHEAREAVSTVLRAIAAPHRKAPTVTDAVRAALMIAASTMGVRDATTV